MTSFRTLVLTSLLLLVYSPTRLQATAAQQAGKSASALYDTIRRIAFPASPDLADNKIKPDGRFILMMPGKILNYQDYHPGEEYTEFIQNKDKDMRFAIVPPHTMEKWFDLADVIPSANPLSGQDTGRSLANIYRSILTKTTIKNLKEQGEAIQSLYNQAIGFLNEVMPHPENLGTNTTRLALYNEYKELYNDRRLEMEDKIETKRKNLQYLDYELWFQRHYPSLLAKVESAYVRWLIFGQKEMCDIYITYLDTGASAKVLEEARVIMRSAGVSSLDRTRTVYPVSFEPSDWYKFLLPPLKRPSRTELQELLGRIDGKINTINAVIAFYKAPNTALDGYETQLTKRQTNQSNIRDTAIQDYLRKELACTARSMGIQQSGDNPCSDLPESAQKVSNYSANAADAIASVGDYNWGAENKKTYIASLEAEIRELERKRGLVLGALGRIDPLVGSILNSDPVVIAGIIDAHKEDSWLEFQFNSEDYKSSTNYKSSYNSFRAKARWGGWFASASYSYSSSTSRTNYQTNMAQSSLKAKGKLLRVHIKRPWFKPEVFDDRNLVFIGNTESGGKVLGSPGRGSTEIEFINKINADSTGDTIYQLPEYVTSFLLAREVELEFSNINRRTFRDTVSTFTRHSARASFFCFSASFSSTRQNYQSRSSVHRTANGMTIKMPGAQVIGYYTQILPKFPASQ